MEMFSGHATISVAKWRVAHSWPSLSVTRWTLEELKHSQVDGVPARSGVMANAVVGAAVTPCMWCMQIGCRVPRFC
jgi:hypothetical protein